MENWRTGELAKKYIILDDDTVEENRVKRIEEEIAPAKKIISTVISTGFKIFAAIAAGGTGYLLLNPAPSDNTMAIATGIVALSAGFVGYIEGEKVKS